MHVEKSTQNLFLQKSHGSIRKFFFFWLNQTNLITMLINLGNILVKYLIWYEDPHSKFSIYM